MIFDLTVTAQVASDANHCGIYDLSSTNLIGVCSSCLGSVSCSTNTGCLAGTANLAGAVLLDCNAASLSVNGDSGLAGVPVTLLGAANNPLATNTTDAQRQLCFHQLGRRRLLRAGHAADEFRSDLSPWKYQQRDCRDNGALLQHESCLHVYFGYANTLPPIISVVPGAPLGCNPANLPTDASVASNVTAITYCGAATTNITHVDGTNGCLLTRTFTIIVTDTYGNSATNSTLSYTWTANATPPVISGVPAGTNYGCNPASVPSTIAGLSASNACGTAGINQSSVITTNGCLVTQIFTIVATDGCGNTATAYVTNTWTANTTPPVISGVPAGTNYGLNPAYCDEPTCLPSFPPGGGAATISITTPWALTGDKTAADNPAYFSDQVTVGNAEVPAGTYPGWCIDTANSIVAGPMVYNTLLFSSCDTNLDGELQALGLDYPGSVYVTPQVWNEINYILNHENGAYFYNVQVAIWKLIGGPVSPGLLRAPYPPYTASAVNALLAAASNNAASWQLQCGDVMGVIVAEITGNDANPVQLTMLEIPYPCVPCISSNIAGLSASNACGTAAISQSSVITTNCCLVTQVFTIVATDGCGNTATAYVTNTWTVSTTPPVISGVPAGTNYGCNPASVPSTIAGLSASNACGTAGINQSSVITTNGCLVTQIFTIVATDGCGNTATAYVTNTWTVNTTPPVISGVPAGTNYGCNPASVPSTIAGLSASNACGTAGINQSSVITTNGCLVTQIFTIVAIDGCGNTATAYVTNTWTANTTPPVISGVPTNSFLGCGSTQAPGDTNVFLEVSASAQCGTASITVTHQDSTNDCTGMRTFTITATDGCGNTTITNLVYTWTAVAMVAAPPSSNSTWDTTISFTGSGNLDLSDFGAPGDVDPVTAVFNGTGVNTANASGGEFAVTSFFDVFTTLSIPPDPVYGLQHQHQYYAT